MLSLPSSVRISLSTEPADMRRSFDGLAFLVQHLLKSDPLSGQIALLAEAKAMGALVKEGWRPKRTVIYGSWDAEEPMLLGSTEWAETHEAELKQKGLVYVNSDGNGRGFLKVEGSHSLQHLVNIDDAGTEWQRRQRGRTRREVSCRQ